ncbi:MAG: hypothetical protein HYZ14_18550 [Bacteroidetes bacterium]|nr:hypothetical protein [Bacteroidota bacterium]
MKYLLIYLAFWSCLPVYAGAVELPLPVSDSLQPGDIIIRKGGGPLSYQLMNESKENYSHCGIIVRHENSWKVIQSMADQKGYEDGVQLIPLAEFVKYTADSTLFICRAVIDTTKNEALAQRAFYYLGQKIPFDHRFDLKNAARFYCSELLLHIFMDVFGQYVFEIRRQHQTYIPLFATFFDTAKFRAIFDLKRAVGS